MAMHKILKFQSSFALFTLIFVPFSKGLRCLLSSTFSFVYKFFVNNK